jgi:hypothetical protein
MSAIVLVVMRRFRAIGVSFCTKDLYNNMAEEA